MVEHNNIAKFGGTSMANPTLVLGQLAYAPNDFQTLVVSAPGSDEDYAVKVTDMLLSYEAKPTEKAERCIQDRFADLNSKLDLYDKDSLRMKLIGSIPTTLKDWRDRGYPVAALGEYWSAKMFASASGRTFIDASELIFFDNQGGIDLMKTTQAYQKFVLPSQKYVVPGFYGSLPNGKIGTFARGGSDISGAVLAFVSEASDYYNWSDVPGLMSANPRMVPSARLVGNVTYREARELANGGSELLHRSAIKLLGHSSVITTLRNTFGAPNEIGTTISRDREWQDLPLIGVTGQSDLIELSLHEFGLKEEIGGTLDLYRELGDRNVSYEHTATATDDVSIFIEDKYKATVAAIVEDLKHPERELRTRKAGMVHVVGEGLAQSGTERMRVLGTVALAFAEAGIEGMGATDVAGSAAITLFVKPEKIDLAIKTAHHSLKLYKD